MTNPYGIATLWEQSDLIIKSVAAMLFFMSIFTWYIIVQKSLIIYQSRKLKQQIQAFWTTDNLDNAIASIDNKNGPEFLSSLAKKGQSALTHHHQNAEQLQGQLPLSDWLVDNLKTSIDDTRESLQERLSFLASVGSTSPFIGLFGTVWGIYHALVAISMSGSSSIDKIAGPVGEALIMTAFGLAVAIPAVLAYNAINRSNKAVIFQLNKFAQQYHVYLLANRNNQP
jgi:biopolymer transport protein ExbB